MSESIKENVQAESDTQTQAPAVESTQIARVKAPAPTASQRFVNKVMSEFSGGVGELALTNFQKRLIQNYFIAIDAVLKAAEDKRLKKNANNKDHKYDDNLAVAWDNVDYSLLARSVVAKARIGLDPAQKNHVSMVPFKNNAMKKYSIVFIDGYRGIELQSMKYGLDVPDAVIVELVYSHDHFKEIKKNLTNPINSYEFEVIDSFDRGEIKGGFYYHAYKNNPEKNKLVVLTLKDILKRKPAYASVEFWGGEKDVWDNGKKVGTERVEGWYEKMCYKTIYRAAYSDITIDSQKIDDDYLHLKQMEASFSEAAVVNEINENANTEAIDIDYTVVDEETGELIDATDPVQKSDQEHKAGSDQKAPDQSASGSTDQKPTAESAKAGKGKKPF